MRTVLTSDEIAAAWVAQSQPEARCPARMSFKGARFFSYGTTVAEIVKHRGKTAFLVNSWTYSDSTSRHVNLIRCAIPRNAKRFEVPGVQFGSHGSFNDLQRILKTWQHDAEYLLEKSRAVREPKKTRLIIEAHAVVATMREFAAYFRLNLKPYAVTLPMTDDEIRRAVKLRKREAVERRREMKERARLGQVLRRLHPDKELTTRHVYSAWQAAQRDRLTTALQESAS